MARKVRDPQARERIVEAARRAIAELGLRGATVRVIAAEAGVSTGCVMHYFVDKDELAAAVLAATNARAGTRVQRASRARRGLAALAAAVEALLPLDAERRLEWQVWAAFWSGSNGDAVGHGLPQARSALTEMLNVPFHEAIADGELPDGLDVAYECDRLTTLAAGLGLVAGADRSPAVRRLARRMLDDHLTALAAVPA